jgi:hypothetical protein
MTEKTTREETPTPEEFDQWTEQDDRAALAAIADTMKVRHIIKNDCVWFLAPHGHLYKLPLTISINDFEQLSSAQDDAESAQSLKRILREFAGEEYASQLANEPVQVTINILAEYGTLITKAQGVDDLGKSPDSSTSSASPAATE